MPASRSWSLKLGASPQGRAAALAHTGAVAGPMEEFDALAADCGILRVRSLDDIVEAVEFFTHLPLPRGLRLGGITFSGALRGLLLDAAAANGLGFPELAPATRGRLEAVLGVGTFIGNPLDSGFAGLGSKEVYVECVAAMLDDPSIDILLLQEELPRGPGSERKEANLRAVNALAPSHQEADRAPDHDFPRSDRLQPLLARAIAGHRLHAGGRQDAARGARHRNLCATGCGDVRQSCFARPRPVECAIHAQLGENNARRQDI